MPTYEYECKKCGVFEVDQRITEDALTVCPHCKKKTVQRIISAPAFHLKGGGWYKDLYSSGKKEALDSSSSPATSSGTSTASASADSTPTPTATTTKEKATEKKSLKTAGGCGSGGCGCK